MMVQVTMQMDRVTKNTVRFRENLPSETAVAVLGLVYVPKPTLQQIGWNDGDPIVFTIETQQAP